MAEQRPKPRKPETETESKEKTAPQAETVNLSPEELKAISGGCTGHGFCQTPVANSTAHPREPR